MKPQQPAPPRILYPQPPADGGLLVVGSYHYAAPDRGRRFFDARYGHGPVCGAVDPLAAVAAALDYAAQPGPTPDQTPADPSTLWSATG